MLSVSLPVPLGYVYTIRSRNSHPGGITSLSRGAPATLCCGFNGLEESCGLLQASTLLAGQRDRGIRNCHKTHVSHTLDRSSVKHPLEGRFEKKKYIVKPCLGSQTLFSSQNYVLFAIITMSAFCAQCVTWDSADLTAFSRSTGVSQLFSSTKKTKLFPC